MRRPVTTPISLSRKKGFDIAGMLSALRAIEHTGGSVIIQHHRIGDLEETRIEVSRPRVSSKPSNVIR